MGGVVLARTLLPLAALLLSLSLQAQEHPPFCTSPLIPGPNDQSGHLTFNPATPQSTDPVTITTGRHIFVPGDISATVEGQVVEVYVTGHPDGFTTPAGDMCLSTSLPPLAAGTYSVNIYSMDTEQAGDPPLLFLSQSLVVTGGGEPLPAAVPALSVVALAILSFVLAIAAACFMSRVRIFDGTFVAARQDS